MVPHKKLPNVLKGPKNLDNDNLSDLPQFLYSGNPITLKSHNIFFDFEDSLVIFFQVFPKIEVAIVNRILKVSLTC